MTLRHLAAVLVGVGVLVFALLGARVRYELFRVPSGSGLPGIAPSDHLVVDRWTYGYHPFHAMKPITDGRLPRRGELAVFWSSSPSKAPLVKRVIGLPGDAVTIDPDGVSINGVRLPRCPVGSWLDPEGQDSEVFVETAGTARYAIEQHRTSIEPNLPATSFQVPSNAVYVLGDNRDDSLDSRQFGSVPRGLLLGRVVTVLGTGTGSLGVPNELVGAAAPCLAR